MGPGRKEELQVSKPKLGDTIATWIFRALIGATGCIALYFSIERAYHLDAAAMVFAVLAMFAIFYALGLESTLRVSKVKPDNRLFVIKLAALMVIGTLGWVHFQYELGAETFLILGFVMVMVGLSKDGHAEMIELKKRLEAGDA